MHVHSRRFAAVVAACGVAAIVPATAGAAVTKNVYAGTPPDVNQIAGKYIPHAKQFSKLYQPDINAFFNQHTTINVGDSVSFKFRGFHTVDIPAKGGSDLPIIVPTSTIASGFNDAAGSPFWFDGKVPVLSFNPALGPRSKSTTYNGSARLESGLGGTKPFTVKFTKPGTYKFFCDVHAGMVGTVTVKPKGQTIPTAKQDLAASDAQAIADVKSAVKLPKVKLPANTVSVGESAPGGVELFNMFPATLQVKAGTTVTFEMSKNSRETHTVTFGPPSYLKPLAKSFAAGPMITPIGTYPSDPVQPLTLTPTSHGNGFVNVGALDQDPTTAQIHPSSTIDFTTPGTYHYVCLIHPFMHGTIIVK